MKRLNFSSPVLWFWDFFFFFLVEGMGIQFGIFFFLKRTSSWFICKLWREKEKNFKGAIFFTRSEFSGRGSEKGRINEWITGSSPAHSTISKANFTLWPASLFPYLPCIYFIFSLSEVEGGEMREMCFTHRTLLNSSTIFPFAQVERNQDLMRKWRVWSLHSSIYLLILLIFKARR